LLMIFFLESRIGLKLLLYQHYILKKVYFPDIKSDNHTHKKIS